jgi:hypothetical protein
MCGVCTLACSTDGDCATIGGGAQCLASSTAEGASCEDHPDATSGACDVSCQSPSDCAALGGAFDCVQSRCRTTNGGAPSVSECTVTWPGFAVHESTEPGTPCPASPPVAGTPCDIALSEIGCVYPPFAYRTETRRWVYLCGDRTAPGVWSSFAVYCGHDCSLPAGQTWIPVTTECASRSVALCPTAGATVAENTARDLGSLYDACNLGVDNSLLVTFEAGCATQFTLARTDDATAVACVTQALSSTRLDCAPTGCFMVPLAPG